MFQVRNFWGVGATNSLPPLQFFSPGTFFKPSGLEPGSNCGVTARLVVAGWLRHPDHNERANEWLRSFQLTLLALGLDDHDNARQIAVPEHIVHSHQPRT